MIELKNVSDLTQFMQIVQTFIDKRDEWQSVVDKLNQKIDELEAELDNKRATNHHLGEQKKEHRQTIADLREELRLTIEKNEMLERAVGELQDRIQDKTPQSRDKSVVAKEQHIEALEHANNQLQKTVTQLKASLNRSTQEKARLERIIANKENNFSVLVCDYNTLKDERDYIKLISIKLCEVIKRHYPKFTYQQFCRDFDKETKRIKKWNAEAKAEKKKWHKIFKTDHGVTYVQRPNQQSS